MTDRTMYDSIRPALIPADAEMVAGYVNGNYAWKPEDWARFPTASHIRIDVQGTMPFDSDVIDVERGDAGYATAAEWVRQRMTHRWWSAAYVDRANLDALREAVDGLDVEFWVADWTGAPHVLDVPRLCAVQYKMTLEYDISLVPNDQWFPTR
jgi:hypothetical protein